MGRFWVQAKVALLIVLALQGVSDAGVVFWGEPEGDSIQLYRANVDGSDKQALTLFPNKQNFRFDVDPVGKKIYAVSATAHDPISLYRADLDGTNLELLSNSRDFGTIPVGMVRNPKNGDIYVTPHTLILDTPGSTPGGMQRVLDNGAIVETLPQRPWYAYDLEVDTVGDKVYYTDYQGYGGRGSAASGIHRMNFDGSGSEQLLSDRNALGKYLALDLENDQIFYTRTGGSQDIFRYEVSSGSLTTAISSTGLNVHDVDLMRDTGDLIWSGSDNLGDWYIQTGDPISGDIKTSFRAEFPYSIVYVESVAAVPEPSTLSAFAVGGLLLTGRRRRRRAS